MGGGQQEDFETSNFALAKLDYIASNNATPPNPSQTASPSGDQVSKQMSLWGPFSIKPPQVPCSVLHVTEPLSLEVFSTVWGRFHVHTQEGCPD